jgi:hypothetical protein
VWTVPKIEELWAWVCQDGGPDDEGIPAIERTKGEVLPLVGADASRAESLRRYGQMVADQMGKPVTLRKSVRLVDVLTLYPSRDSLEGGAHAENN